MKSVAESYLKVHYELRPHKQVERRMLVDTFFKLSAAGFNIRDYQYTGLGSIFFTDFLIFHKALGIKNMLSVEHSRKISKRVRFNKPYRFIKVKVDSMARVIPSLSKEVRHILWLDYDDLISTDVIHDTFDAAYTLPAGSILIITVDAEPPRKSNKISVRRDFFRQVCGDFIGDLSDVELSALLTNVKLPWLNSQILFNVIEKSVSARDKIQFYPLFNFEYADGHRMLTIGGLIGGKEEKEKMRLANLDESPYIRLSKKRMPYKIKVPVITRKERLFLDSAMPCGKRWRPSAFEMKKNDLNNYRDIYQFFPNYAELML